MRTCTCLSPRLSQSGSGMPFRSKLRYHLIREVHSKDPSQILPCPSSQALHSPVTLFLILFKAISFTIFWACLLVWLLFLCLHLWPLVESKLYQIRVLGDLLPIVCQVSTPIYSVACLILNKYIHVGYLSWVVFLKFFYLHWNLGPTIGEWLKVVLCWSLYVFPIYVWIL